MTRGSGSGGHGTVHWTRRRRRVRPRPRTRRRAERGNKSALMPAFLWWKTFAFFLDTPLGDHLSCPRFATRGLSGASTLGPARAFDAVREVVARRGRGDDSVWSASRVA